MARCKVVGVDRIIQNLGKLEKNAEANLEDLVRLSLREIVVEAKSRAPVSKATSLRRIGQRTGEYRDSIASRSDKLSGYAAPLRKGNRVHPLGHLLEFGTVKMTAKPHLFPAFEMVRGTLGQRISEAVRKAGTFR